MITKLTRRFTGFNMLLLSVNGMIGSAWLFAPLYAAKIAGPMSLIAWIIGGAITILIAFTFAELTALFPTAGGSSNLPLLSHGTLTSFLVSWAAWLSSVTMPPIEVQAVLQYSSSYFPQLTHVVNGAPVLTALGLFCALLIMLGLCIINVASFKGLVRFNLLLFSFKVLVIILTILMLIKTAFHPQNFFNTNFGTTPTTWHVILAAITTGGVAFAFTGFKHGVELAGEAKNPKRSIPFGIIGSIIVCLLLYMGLQIAFIGALHPSTLTQGWGGIHFSGDISPFVGIATLLGIAWLVKLLFIDAAVSPLGAGLIYVTSTARLIYAMSKNGFLPSPLSRINKEGFPIYAIAFNFAVGMLLFLPLPGWQNMVDFLVSAVVISYAMGPITLLCLRLSLPNEIRPWRLPAAKILCPIAFYCCNLMGYWTGWNTISKLAIALAIGLGLYIVATFNHRMEKNRMGLKSLIWIIPYLTGMVIISYLGSFDGKKIIPFGWDFATIGIFSIVILILALKCRLPEASQNIMEYRTELSAPSEI